MLTSNPNRVRIHSQKIVPGLETFSQVRNVSPDLREVRVRPHKRSDANLKRITLAASVSANPNVVRVQRLTRAGSANANPNVVRVPSRSSW